MSPGQPGELFHPFPGLRPFGADEDYLFFGREEHSDELLRRLRQHRFLAVVGGSGSGKSSLVRAGLLPALHGGFMAGKGSGWRIVDLRPGGQPIRALAESLCVEEILGTAASEIDHGLWTTLTETTLRRSARGLVEVVKERRLGDGINLLVLIDQFEEIFRYQSGNEDQADEAAAFVKLLLEASANDVVPIYVVLTMRSDYLGDCAQFRDLPEAINEGQFLIPRMTRDQRQRAIEGPARVGGGVIAQRLVQQLLNDVGDNPDQLPILQHALMRTWDHWVHRGAEGPLDLRDYRALGGMREALSRHGDEVYRDLESDRAREIARKMFRRLTDRGNDARGIRRPTRLSTLASVCDCSEQEVAQVVEAFRRADRSLLMPPAGVELRSETVIDISHESLMRVWRRLDRWVDEESRSAEGYRRLAEAAELHRIGETSLWEDPELELALAWKMREAPTSAWAEIYHPGFEQALSFLEASRKARDERLQRKEEARRRELEQAKKEAEAARRLRRLLMVVGILGALSLVALGFAVKSRSEAAEQSRIARSGRLASMVRGQLDNQLDLALLLAVAAHQVEPTEASQNALLDALERSPRLDRFLRGHATAVSSVAFDPANPARLASASEDGAVLLWDLESGAISARLSGDPTETVLSMAFHPQGGSLVTGGSSGRPTFWDLETGQAVGTLQTGIETATANDDSASWESITAVAYSPSGELAAGSVDGVVRLWRLDGPSQPIATHQDRVSALAWSPDGRALASASWDGTVRLTPLGSQLPSSHGAISASTPGRDSAITSVTRTFGELEGQLVYCVSWSRDGRFVAWGSDDGLVYLQDLEQEAPFALTGHENAVYTVAFSPDSQRLASGSWDNTVWIWDRETRTPIGPPLRGHQEYVRTLAYSSDGKSLASGGYDNSVILWRAESSVPKDQILRVNDGSTNVDSSNDYRVLSLVLGLSFDPAGERFAAGLGDNTVRVWDANTRRQIGKPLLGHRSLVDGVAFSPDGALLASASLDHRVILWDVAKQESIRILDAHDSSVLSVAFSPDGRLLASADWAGDIHLWNVSELSNEGIVTAKATLNSDHGAISSVAFRPNGNELAAATRDRMVVIWDLEEERPRPPLDHHQTFVYTVAYSLDGALLASGGGDNRVLIWNAETGELLHDLEGHRNYVQRVAFGPKGRHLASASWDRDVRIWNVASGQRVARLEGHTRVVHSLAFHPREELLLSGSWDETIHLWDLSSLAVAAESSWTERARQACRIANREMDEKTEWPAIELGEYRTVCADLAP